MATSARTIRQGKLGKYNLRLVQKDGHFYGLVDGKKCVDGADAEDVWRRLRRDAGKTDPKYFGFAGARSRFLKFFPNGFHSDGFASEERDYKLAASTKLDATAPLAEALNGSGLGTAVLSAFQATNMLSRFEIARIADVLRGRDADAFVRAAARFADDATAATLSAIERVLRPNDCAKWTVTTYLPFLWRPEAHMFLKPEATKDFAVRVGHPFASDYRAKLELDVYLSLLDLANETSNELSDLEPRDRIDIQSFIWVVGDYREDREEVYP